MAELLIAIILALALTHGAAAGSQPAQPTEFVGDARLALQVVADRAGKRFIDESAGSGQTLVRFDSSARDLQKMEPLLREIARQLPTGWRIVIRDAQIVLQNQNRQGGG